MFIINHIYIELNNFREQRLTLVTIYRYRSQYLIVV